MTLPILYPDSVRVFKKTVDVGSISANTTGVKTVTCDGLLVGKDMVLAVEIPSGLDAGVGLVGATVTAANTITLRFINTTAGAIDPAAASYTILTTRHTS